MPRPGPRRPLVALRLSDQGIEWLDQRAEDEGVNRSEMIRIALAYAVAKMPKGWRPPQQGVER
jgi:metal-responsive CopG/Arc/MetJ family transcriptional regulator